MDLLYYMNNREKINVITKIYENNKRELHAGELFAEHIAIISDKPTILEQELELIKKCFEGDYMKNAFEKYNKMLVKSFFNKNYVGVLSYPDRMRDLEKSSMYNDLDKETYWFIQLLENNS